MLLRRSGSSGRLRTAADALHRGGVSGLASLLADRIRVRASEKRHRLERSLRSFMQLTVQPRLLARSVVHLHGPAVLSYAPDELITITVVRNAPLHVKSFVEHHRSLGIAHSVFLDNGSDDDTVERLCSYDGVTVLRCSAPYSRYENSLKWYLTNRFAAGRWSLSVDIDELFDYPCRARLTVRDLLRYLNARGFTAVVGQMLDMFGDGPLSHVRFGPNDRLQQAHPFYDISDIDRPPYQWSQPSSPDVRMHWGGIRRTVFGTSNGLTKACLVRLDGRVQPFVEWHHVLGARVADITCLLRHYPFVPGFVEKIGDAVRTRRYGRTTTGEYEAYARALARDPQLTLRRATAQRFTNVDALVERGFLTVSTAYREWVRRTGDVTGAGGTDPSARSWT
jgi:hypothetical protein